MVSKILDIIMIISLMIVVIELALSKENFVMRIMALVLIGIFLVLDRISRKLGWTKMNSETDINCNDDFAEFESGKEKIKRKKVAVFLANGTEMVTNNVLSVSEYNNERGGLALELYGKSKTGKTKKMVFNLTSNNIIGYSIEDQETSKS